MYRYVLGSELASAAMLTEPINHHCDRIMQVSPRICIQGPLQDMTRMSQRFSSTCGLHPIAQLPCTHNSVGFVHPCNAFGIFKQAHTVSSQIWTMHIPVVVLHIAEYSNKNYWGPGFSGLVIDTPARNISSVDSKLTAMTELQQRTSLHLGIY